MPLAASQETSISADATAASISADATAASISALVAAGLDEKDAVEVEAWQRAMDEATMRVQEWAALQVGGTQGPDAEEATEQAEYDRTARLQSKRAESKRASLEAERRQSIPHNTSDTVQVPVHFAANCEEFIRAPIRWDEPIEELRLAIMRERALPLRPRLFFKGRLMDPSDTLETLQFDEEWLFFTYRWDQHLETPMKDALLQERMHKNVTPENWKRFLRIADKDGVPLAMQWDDRANIKIAFAELQDRFPMTVRLETKVLCEVNACIATCAEDRTARIWDAITGQCELVLRGHTDVVNSSCFAPDNATILTCSADHTIKIWSLVTGECLHTLHGHEDSVSAAMFSPFDRASLLTYGDDCTGRLWNMKSMQCVATMAAHSEPIFMARFNKNGTITTAGQDEKLLLWDACTGKYQRAERPPMPPAELYSYSPDGRLTVTASPARETSIWDVETGVCELVLGGHERQVTHTIFSPASEAMTAAAKARREIIERPPKWSVP